jgi:hypothetical protein
MIFVTSSSTWCRGEICQCMRGYGSQPGEADIHRQQVNTTKLNSNAPLTSVSSIESCAEITLRTFFLLLSCISPAKSSSSSMKYAFWKLKIWPELMLSSIMNHCSRCNVRYLADGLLVQLQFSNGDNSYLAHIAVVFVHLLDISVNDLESYKFVIRRGTSGNEEKGSITAVDYLRVCKICFSQRPCKRRSIQPLYSRKLHILVRRASTSCETSLMIFAFSFGDSVVNHFASLW